MEVTDRDRERERERERERDHHHRDPLICRLSSSGQHHPGPPGGAEITPNPERRSSKSATHTFKKNLNQTHSGKH